MMGSVGSDDHEAVLVFDSGLGGLSVLAEINAALPAEKIVYCADTACFPYGDLAPEPLIERVGLVIAAAMTKHRLKALVIACNSASTLVLPMLRERYAIPVVGTVPAIKPAAQATQSGMISVLATPGTVRRDYTRDLIDQFASTASVTLVGAAGLAAIAEAKLTGRAVDWTALKSEIGPAFVERGGQKTDCIVLGCTHYPLLENELRKAAPWPVRWLDPAEAIARRLASVLPPAPSRGDDKPGRGLFLTTGSAEAATGLDKMAAGFGLCAPVHLPVQSSRHVGSIGV